MRVGSIRTRHTTVCNLHSATLYHSKYPNISKHALNHHVFSLLFPSFLPPSPFPPPHSQATRPDTQSLRPPWYTHAHSLLRSSPSPAPSHLHSRPHRHSSPQTTPGPNSPMTRIVVTRMQRGAMEFLQGVEKTVILLAWGVW